MLASPVIAGLNHMLADAPWARQRLSPFAGRTAILRLLPLEIGLGIDSKGYFTATTSTDPDVCLDLPLASLPKAIGGSDALMSDIRISGNADFADALGFVLRQLRWDGEESLAKLIGDIPARRAVQTAQQIGAWHQRTARNVVENLAEYFVEERPLVVKRKLIDEMSSETAELRDALARLEKRLNKLESR